MAFTITKNKDLENHVDFDISFITSNLKDGEYFADDKKITPRTKNYIIKIPKTSQSKLNNALRKEYGSTMTRDSISLETDTGVELVLKKTGKTTVGSSDGQTTAMQERASLLIIQDGLMNNKRYTSVKDIMTKNPISVSKDTLVDKALSIMYSRKITSLIVCDSSNKKKTIGIIHIHNILENSSN